MIAGTLAQSSAIASFPLGATAGSLWYGVFPAQASPFLVAGATAGVLGVAALATTFAGIVSDPVQRAAGLHRRRLNALVTASKPGFRSATAAGFVAYDLYVARLLDLGDVLIGIARNLRSPELTPRPSGSRRRARRGSPARARRAAAAAGPRPSAAAESRIGLRGAREPASSCTAPRATACGSAKASATLLIGPAGTPPSAIAASTSARGIAAIRAASAADHRLPVREPVAVLRESRIAVQREPQASAEPRELAVVAAGDHQRPVGRLEHLVGHDVRMRVAHPPRRDAADQRIRRLVRQHRELQSKSAEVDPLPVPVRSRSRSAASTATVPYRPVKRSA